jgi:hypothetical protein
VCDIYDPEPLIIPKTWKSNALGGLNIYAFQSSLRAKGIFNKPPWGWRERYEN